MQNNRVTLLASVDDTVRRDMERVLGGERIQLLAKPVRCTGVGVWFSFDWLSPFSLAVASVTNKAWSHVGLAFGVEDGEHHCVCYEARFPRVVGPIVFDDVYRRYRGMWHRFAVRWLPVGENVRLKALQYAERCVAERRAYALWQLLRIWTWVRLGLQPPREDERAVTCTEFVARALEEVIPWRDYAPTLDALFPGHVFQAVKDWLTCTTNR